MFNENQYIIWGTYCKYCGNEYSILQSKYHPWADTDFKVKLKCSKCKNEVVIDNEKASKFYDSKIYSYFKDVYGSVIDLGCGGGFLSRHIIKYNEVDKVYGVDVDDESKNETSDITSLKFQFIHSDIKELPQIFKPDSVDFLVSRDVFMFIEDTDKYFDDTFKIVKHGIKQMGWFVKGNTRMKNNLLPEDIAAEYEKRGWKTELTYLDWYKCGYFINAYK